MAIMLETSAQKNNEKIFLNWQLGKWVYMKLNIGAATVAHSGLEKYSLTAVGNPLRWPRDTLCPQKLAVTSPTSGVRSVGVVRLQTKSHGVFLQ
jgi:hypothetical protein